MSIRKELTVFYQLSCSLGKQILDSFTVFFPLQISVVLEEMRFALCMWVTTLSFCLSVQ